MERLKVLLTRILDHTIPGYGGLEMGLSSLGVRAQALRLQPFGREHLQKRDSFLPLEANFCMVCGTKVEKAELSCSQCGTKALPGATFCNQCGEKL